MLRALRRPAVVVVLVATLVLAAGGCSGGGSSSRYHKQIAESLQLKHGEGSLTFTPKEADCVATKLTARISDERLQELGIGKADELETLQFSAAERTSLFESFDGCLDFEAQLVKAFTEGGAGMTEDQAHCVAKRYVASSVFREAVTASDPDTALNARIDALLNDATSACGVTDAG